MAGFNGQQVSGDAQAGPGKYQAREVWVQRNLGTEGARVPGSLRFVSGMEGPRSWVRDDPNIV